MASSRTEHDGEPVDDSREQTLVISVSKRREEETSRDAASGLRRARASSKVFVNINWTLIRLPLASNSSLTSKRSSLSLSLSFSREASREIGATRGEHSDERG